MKVGQGCSVVEIANIDSELNPFSPAKCCVDLSACSIFVLHVPPRNKDRALALPPPMFALNVPSTYFPATGYTARDVALSAIMIPGSGYVSFKKINAL